MTKPWNVKVLDISQQHVGPNGKSSAKTTEVWNVSSSRELRGGRGSRI